jgi:hypothetical protein
MGLDTKTYWLTDRQSQCDFYFWLDFDLTMRVVGGDEKGILKSETVKYSHESQRTRTQERLRWRGPAAYSKDRPVLSSVGAPQGQERNCQKVINIWSWAPDEARHQDLLIDCTLVAMWLWLWLETQSFLQRSLWRKDLSLEAEKWPLLEPLPGNVQ